MTRIKSPWVSRKKVKRTVNQVGKVGGWIVLISTIFLILAIYCKDYRSIEIAGIAIAGATGGICAGAYIEESLLGEEE